MYLPILKSLSVLGAIIFAGWFSRRTRIFLEQDTKVIASFVYNFSLPALFFSEILRTDFQTVEPVFYAGVMLPVLLIFSVLVLLRVLRFLSKDIFILLALSISFGSYAFFGVPFFESLYGRWGLDMAVLTGSILSIFGIVATVGLFEYATGSRKGFFFLFRVLRSPLIIAVILGFGLSFLKPRAIFFADIAYPLGKTASATAIFILGMFIYDHFSYDMVKKGLFLTLFRMVSLPIVTMIVLFALDSDNSILNRLLLMQGGIPAAISTAIFADRYKYMKTELTGMVVLTSLSGFVMLAILYFVSLVLW